MPSRIEQLKAFLAQTPDDPFLHHALGLEWVKVGNDSEAEKAFEENRTARPAYVATYYHLGKLLERAGRRGEALAAYGQGMEAARAAGDNHTFLELEMAHEDLEDAEA